MGHGGAGDSQVHPHTHPVPARTPPQPLLPTTASEASQEPVGEAAGFAPFYYSKITSRQSVQIRMKSFTENAK